MNTPRIPTFAPTLACIAALTLSLSVGGCEKHAMSNDSGVNTSLDQIRVISVLDDLHVAAGRAEGPRYFAHFADNAVFLGTDASERWSKQEFVAYATPYFSQGKGWTYIPSDRHIAFSNDGQTAWFDERVTNEKYGQCRGTGVLTRTGDSKAADGGWKITQYNLTLPIPNDLMPKVAEMIKAAK